MYGTSKLGMPKSEACPSPSASLAVGTDGDDVGGIVDRAGRLQERARRLEPLPVTLKTTTEITPSVYALVPTRPHRASGASCHLRTVCVFDTCARGRMIMVSTLT